MKTAEHVTARTPDRVEALIEEARRRQRRRRWVTGLVVATAVVAGVAIAVATWGPGRAGPSPARTSSAPSPPVAAKGNGLIYFSQGGGDGATWTDALEPDGSGRHRVLANCYYCADVAWSPDGRKIAYVGIAQQARQSADGQVHCGIYVAGPNGSHAHLLAEGLNDAWPAWSPDGKRIVFVSKQDRPGVKNCMAGWDVSTPCPTDIYVMNADGTGTRRLTHDPATEYAPAWSPNGQSVAFVRNVRNRAGRVEQAIYVMNADGTDMREVATGTGGNGRPFSWAPEGQ